MREDKRMRHLHNEHEMRMVREKWSVFERGAEWSVVSRGLSSELGVPHQIVQDDCQSWETGQLGSGSQFPHQRIIDWQHRKNKGQLYRASLFRVRVPSILFILYNQYYYLINTSIYCILYNLKRCRSVWARRKMSITKWI